MTPGIKLLLQRKNCLMRIGHLEEASACARRVGRAIERLTKRHFAMLTLSQACQSCGDAMLGSREVERVPLLTPDWLPRTSMIIMRAPHPTRRKPSPQTHSSIDATSNK